MSISLLQNSEAPYHVRARSMKLPTGKIVNSSDFSPIIHTERKSSYSSTWTNVGAIPPNGQVFFSVQLDAYSEDFFEHDYINSLECIAVDIMFAELITITPHTLYFKVRNVNQVNATPNPTVCRINTIVL